MSEEKSTGPKPEAVSDSNQEQQHEAEKNEQHFPEAITAPQPATGNQPPETNNQQPATENMEIHADHLHKAPSQGWKHYLFEFLMLFFAVTLGFFVENFREKITEHKNAAGLAASLYNDLARDTASLDRIAASRYDKMRVMDSLFLLLQAKPQKINTREFFHLILPAFSWSNFSSSQSTGTLTQLKNAGYLRYYTHTGIPSALAAYESSVSELADMEKMEQQQIVDKGFSFLNEEIDPALFNMGYSNNEIPEGSYVIPRHSDSFRSLYGNCVSIGILNRNIAQEFVKDAKQKAVDLMNELKKEYHLE
ncbi:MAG TPA: hypothetical protein VFW07_13600 [Parafilimonas sp.]|nr:hypothetical protein [Parafilimonas sp.]